MHRLYVLVVLLLQDGADYVACQGIVLHKAHVVLVAVQLKDVDALAIGSPCHVGMVVVLFANEVQPDVLLCLGVIYTYLYDVAIFAGHGIVA